MASHPSYPHPGPGPSSYYQQSPPPHHVYGNHSPGPRPNHYPYYMPPPPPPHLSSHQPAQYHQPQPSRGNHRGNGQYSSRGTHNYHHHYQHQPPYPHSHVAPNVGVHAPHVPYSPQSSKYSQPYSPSYSYPSPTAPVFTPSWQQQPLSPLPKQLSMPPPQNVQPSIYDSSAAETPTAEPPADTQSAEKASVLETAEIQTAVAESSPLSSPESLKLAAQPSQPSLYSQMGTISTSSEADPSSSTTQQQTVTQSSGKWAIWSRRPRDPSQAPSIIISPRSFPPPDVIQQALDDETPPPSVPPSPKVSRKRSLPSFKEQEGTPAKEIPLSPPSQSSDEIAGAAWSSQTASSVPSSSVTETTDTPTIPGSPASSHTSVSVKESNKDISVQDAAVEPDVPSVAESASTSAGSVAAEPQPAEAAPEAKPIEPAAAAEAADGAIPLPTPAPDVVVSAPAPVAAPQPIAAQESPVATTPAASSQSTPAPAPAAAPVKKSWASLLRPSSASASSGSGPSRNALPTSSVVGFSIPASTSPPVPAVSPTKKSELISLLTNGPAPPTAAAVAAGASSASSVMKIRPRGLINTGNMCFANSVLQILLYCPPFHKLFVELGKVLGPSGAGVTSGTSTPVLNGREEKPKAASATPLVDATIEFLKEFVDEKKSRPKEKARLEIVSRSGSGSGLSGYKGKEKEVRSEEDDDDDWDGESFLPTYVYDAMKEKKRFDNMRGGHQEDAEEFFGFYLDTLEEELLSLLNSVNPPRQAKSSTGGPVEEKEEAAPPEDEGWLEVGKRNRTVITRTIKATESPITRIFGGKFRSTLRAPGQKDSVIVEDWRSLRLDIQREQIHTIQDALSYISHPEPVQVTTKPGVTIDAQQQMLIEALPPILVLHIKRFCYDTSVGGVVKVGKHVRFGPELEIRPDIMVPAAKKAHPTRYKLFGALYHHGLSAGGGHYTLDVLHPNRYPSASPAAKPREGWVRIDDNLVSDVRHEDVFGQNEKDEARSPYLLFYRRA